MSSITVLDRFVAHLTANPWTRRESGEREMLAGRPFAEVQMIELNRVLARYVAVSMPIDAVALLPVQPTITTINADRGEAHCLWELADPVTMTKQGRHAPKSFLTDVESAAVACAKECSPDSVEAVRGPLVYVYCPLNTAYSLVTNDGTFSMTSLRQTFTGYVVRSQDDLAPGTRDRHYRSGANVDVFEAMRQQARRLRGGAASADQLAAQLQDWSSKALEVRESEITSSALVSMIGRVAPYVWREKRPVVARRTRDRIHRAATEVAREQQVSEHDAMQHLRKPIAAKAGVSERAVRRARRA